MCRTLPCSDRALSLVAPGPVPGAGLQVRWFDVGRATWRFVPSGRHKARPLPDGCPTAIVVGEDLVSSRRARRARSAALRRRATTHSTSLRSAQGRLRVAPTNLSAIGRNAILELVATVRCRGGACLLPYQPFRNSL